MYSAAKRLLLGRPLRVHVQAGDVSTNPFVGFIDGVAGPVDVFQGDRNLILTCLNDASGPARLDLLGVGVLFDAKKEKRPDLLARQRRQLQVHRWRFI